jgi:phospholipid/cholesterol/gamma-HCH transport system substrate-binding protein
MDPTLVRRISGTAAAVLVVALAYLGLEARYAPPAGSYEVRAVLGTAGIGLTSGSDVKVRGVRVGEVARIDYVDGRAIATLRFQPEPQLPSPRDLHMAVTAKTLLGEKQVELTFPDEAYGEPPFLAAGDTIVTDREPTELAAVLDRLQPFVDAIDSRDLATIVDALGEQQGEADTIVANLELGQQLAAFGERTAEDNLANLRRLADIADALAPVADDMTRLNAALPEATRVLREEQARITTNLEALSRFARGFAEYLEAEEPAISRLLRSGDVVGAMLERRQDQVGDLLYGLFLYFEKFPHGIDLDDGTEGGAFKIFMQFEEEEEEEEEEGEGDDGAHGGSAEERRR